MKSLRTLLLSTLAIIGSDIASAGNVIQTVEFPGLTPQVLYDAYLSSKQHAAMTGMPATYYRPSTQSEVAIGQEGDEFRGFGMTGSDGKFHYLIGGTLLRLVPGREIVMTWKALAWGPRTRSPDCILVLTFANTPVGAEIRLVQVNVPDFPDLSDAKASANGEAPTETDQVNTNWYFRYWEPMRKYFAATAKPAAP
ncbi:MAG TPA: SRPBCC domain-containing protein [Gammaproteobacteria bacterium]|nr:SRPBCC domain-containing protein [Gammaproteobacteria bacterium]